MLENNRMTRQIEEYVAYKRSLGYVIKIEAQELRRFAKYTREIGYDGSITEELAMRWASLDDNFTRKYMARRLETLHTFAVYISAFDEQAQIPRNGVFGKAHTRTDSYIYTDEEVLSLMRGADSLLSSHDSANISPTLKPVIIANKYEINRGGSSSEAIRNLFASSISHTFRTGFETRGFSAKSAGFLSINSQRLATSIDGSFGADSDGGFLLSGVRGLDLFTNT
jgi:hypothetical protein